MLYIRKKKIKENRLINLLQVQRPYAPQRITRNKQHLKLLLQVHDINLKGI